MRRGHESQREEGVPERAYDGEVLMSKRLDLSGKKFGKLTAIKDVGRDKRYHRLWLCKCDCGEEKVVSAGNLVWGNVTSCGCARVKDLTGRRFGKLTVKCLHSRPGKRGGDALWLCQCVCGNETVLPGYSLQSGNTSSCGCLVSTVGGKSRTDRRLYAVWASMRRRCEDANKSNYYLYGGRGIKVCDEWQDFNKFYEWAVANGYDATAPTGKCTIDRIDVNGDYCPENCRWVDMGIQASNRRTNVILEYKGEKRSIQELADMAGITYRGFWSRINSGWTVDEAVETPPYCKRGTRIPTRKNTSTHSGGDVE